MLEIYLLMQKMFLHLLNLCFRAGRGFTAPFIRLRGFGVGKNRAFSRSDGMMRTLKRRYYDRDLSNAVRIRSFLSTLRFSKLRGFKMVYRVFKLMFILKSVFKIHLKLRVMLSIMVQICIRLGLMLSSCRLCRI